MPILKCHTEDFLQAAKSCPVLDVRSPAEYSHAHIPGAHAFPLFSDEERKQIGTTYKQIGREEAIKIGLDHFGPKMRPMVEEASKILSASGSGSKKLAVHCWRGGMRSAAVAWLLDFYGFEILLLEGGYKAYRNWVLQQFELPYALRIIGGYTGSNKTGIIQEMRRRGLRAIDYEHLASHKGSAFGRLGMPPQPSQEQFENMLAAELYSLREQDAQAPIWVEDESQRIGTVNIPNGLFRQMREQAILFLNIPFEERLNFIVETYGVHDKALLLNGIERIAKKLGGPESREAMAYLQEGQIKACFRILLSYYDRYYLKSSMKREKPEHNVIMTPLQGTDPIINLNLIHEHSRI
ncbi:MAG TPA: tRNA 2-selenouridine(34) synthase MnmH [Bacteroidia bacterium]|nr:tRNA 2-selenouridine(34) synthase MnmH [Bacteroidia bacterium]